MKKLFSTIVLCVVFSLGICAYAISSVNASAVIRPDINVLVNGETKYFKSADGNYVYPLIYKDSTYLPIRAMGEVTGKNINWDENTKTIKLYGKKEQSQNTVSKPNYTASKTVKVQERTDFTVMLEDKKCDFTDSKGNKIYPLLYNGSAYLPLRSIGSIIGGTVDWADNTVYLNFDSFTVTDADTFGDTNTKNNGEINLEGAKEIAVKDKGYNVSDVSFTKAEFDYSDRVYEIEFIQNNVKFEYEIDIYGNILKFENDGNSQAGISIESAKAAALKHANLSESNVTYTEIDIDDDKYEIEFYSGNYKYEYKIDMFKGTVLKWEKDYIYH